MKKIRKVQRYLLVYGFGRTLIKVAGRSRIKVLKVFFPKIFFYKGPKEISLIGCGQFGFSTISYFLLNKQGNRFLECFDIKGENMESTAKFWGYRSVELPEKLLTNKDCKHVYIASNHATHTDYAVKALENQKVVYIEKPIAVNYGQFSTLLEAIRKYKGEVYVGYNRPFSSAIICLRRIIPVRKPITLNCFVIGHKIGLNHWYRNPEEGTRVCGNMGHWIDLTVHLLAARLQMPETFEIFISYSNEEEPDDNLNVSITTDFGDLITILLSAREEPFEGINETINFQSGHVIAKIDDFREMKLWNAHKYKRYKFRPKDVGHKRAINQPFNKHRRDFQEIVLSTILMLEITAMVKKKESVRKVSPEEIRKKLEKENYK